jgi:hypothetical protein
MAGAIGDLRLLYLALHVEEDFERLERALERRLPAPIRATLAPLFRGGPAHDRLKAEYDRLNAILAQSEASPEELLRALDDCERLAQAFYELHADDFDEPRLRDLFRALAAEEAGHVVAVGRAMRLEAAAAS